MLAWIQKRIKGGSKLKIVIMKLNFQTFNYALYFNKKILIELLVDFQVTKSSHIQKRKFLYQDFRNTLVENY